MDQKIVRCVGWVVYVYANIFRPFECQYQSPFVSFVKLLCDVHCFSGFNRQKSRDFTQHIFSHFHEIINLSLRGALFGLEKSCKKAFSKSLSLYRDSLEILNLWSLNRYAKNRIPKKADTNIYGVPAFSVFGLDF